MKTLIGCGWATLVLAVAVVLNGEETSAPKKGSPEFERMKTLVGTWQGKVDMGSGPTDQALQYRLVAGGSVVEERIFVGTPHEMVTMYYDQNGRLALTHYCLLGNRPAMRLESSDAKTLTFEFDKNCGIDPEKESHMHGLTIRFDDADTITSTCRSMMNGTLDPGHSTTFKRVKGSASVAKRD